MPLSPESKANPTGPRSRRHHRRFYGLSDEKQRRVFQIQRDAILDMFAAMEEYFTAELDIKLESLDELTRAEHPQAVDAEFMEADDAPLS